MEDDALDTRPPRTGWRRWLGAILVAVGLGVLAIVLFLIDRGEDERYHQTWDQPYASTTCVEWSTDLTSNERWIASWDILRNLRYEIDGSNQVPRTDTVSAYSGWITRDCEDPGTAITDVGVGVYMEQRSRFGPQS